MKKVKDPIYGYIEFDEVYWAQLIDLPEFQRLRHISQTGYRALFPSAHHNRFVHSLGVAHLGSIGFDFFKENIQGFELDAKWNKLRNTFILACLLHDVGHSPFSHAGEDFYVDAIGEVGISVKLKESVNTQSFSSDLEAGSFGKPHEAMSAIIGLSLCSQVPALLEEDDLYDGVYSFDPELFVRAIIGLKYKDNARYIENALISLLNGEYIDVDKLDYIMRDAFTTGYNSLLIDYERLLSGYTLVKDKKGEWVPGFQRKAISVIENVIYAKDLERRWVQKDPTILYDNRIIEYVIREFVDHSKGVYVPAGAFVAEALTTEGISSFDNRVSPRMKLLCDDDIVAFAKNDGTSEAAQQFFDRGLRLKPLWKTELEYRTSCNRVLSGDERELWQRVIRILAEELHNRSRLTIDAGLLEQLKDDVKRLRFLYDSTDEKSIRQKLEGMLERKELTLNFCRLLERFTKEVDNALNSPLDFKFYIIESSGFSPDYDFEKLEAILVDMGHGQVCSLSDSVGVQKKLIRANEDDSCCFFYTTVRNKTVCTDLSSQFWKYMGRNLESISES